MKTSLAKNFEGKMDAVEEVIIWNTILHEDSVHYFSAGQGYLINSVEKILLWKNKNYMH